MKFSLFNEFLNEGKDDGTGKFHPDHAKVIPNGSWYKHAGNYDHYRLLIAAAATDGKTTPKDFSSYGPLGEHPFSSAYSDEDQRIIDLAKKMCGLESSPVAKGGSTEPDHIHRISPVNPDPHRGHPRRPWEAKRPK